jgi:DNA polymerase-3 subunit alpha
VRNAGTHAAGVVISDKPIMEYLPLHRPTSNSEETPIKTVTQFEMGILDSLGMLKVDFLGLITLSVMAKACDMIEKRHGIKFDLSNIPLDDPKSFELMGNGQTAGVFQVEGGGMTRYLVQMKPKTLDNIIAMVALYRPGPMAFIPDYIARMHGEAEVEYRHPALAPIFQDTYGIPVYQEQLMRAAVDLAGYTPSESDELRKAISKKKKDEIEKHRNKFVAGAVRNGMAKEIAEAIYSDWEEFARYGFNKSHAADYGVIAVQTAYLKAHYPAEYMAALMSASAGQTEKVAWYVADARSMGVPVLAPEINTSGWDFEIEDAEEADPSTLPSVAGQVQPNIRFGLGAVKNVGEGAVELIIKERNQNGKFINLNDFARRVDLRAVGKRAIEYLIKVGAMDAFGNRAALLASLDRVVSISSNHFRAAEAGQMSLFGESTGVTEDIQLPDVSNVDKREMLNWERELIGLYVSDHPLTPYQQTFAQIVSYFSGQLHEAQHEEKVRVAGLITAVRPYTTKTNKPMGFVTLEDIQGNIELVLFPKTWQKTHEQLAVGRIIIVEGKVDTGSTPPKILVDEIRTEIKILESLDSPTKQDASSAPGFDRNWKSTRSTQPASLSNAVPPQPKPDPVTPATQPSRQNVPPKKEIPVKPTIPPTVRQTGEKPANYVVDIGFDDMPPPPDNFPEDWDTQWQPSFEEATIAARPEPRVNDQPVSEPRLQTEIVEAEIKPNERELAEAAREAIVVHPIESIPTQSIDTLRMPSLYVPLAQEDKDKDHAPQQITVILRSTGDKEHDRRRIKTIYGTLISFHGRDRFSFQIFEEGKGHLIDFPNDTTRVCPEVLERLKKLMGEESWRVEEITFQ